MGTDASHGVTLPSDQDASGRTLGEEELAMLAEVIASGTLTSTKGTLVAELERSLRCARMVNPPTPSPAPSGKAAVHAAIAAVDPGAGDGGGDHVGWDRHGCSSRRSSGYQGAIPVFADVDPRTGNVTGATIERQLHVSRIRRDHRATSILLREPRGRDGLDP